MKPASLPSKLRSRSGATLTELMVAVIILSIGLLGLFNAFRFISRSLYVSRAQSLATNLAQERVESLKNLNYYSLLLTTAPATTPPPTSIIYDTGNYPPETIVIGGITFIRYTYVTMVDVINGDITAISYTYPDTGMKQVAVTVSWTDMGTQKKWRLTNLLENPRVNPLDATISGNVKISGTTTNLPGAVVRVEQNSDWTATTDAGGNYTFRVYHGTYTVRASSAGFYDAVSPVTTVSRGGASTVNLSLQAIATGTVAGIAWYNSDLVISQVVAATNTVVGDLTRHDVEYVELFNPTTYPIDIGVTAVYPKTVALRYEDENGSSDRDDSAAGFNIHHVTTYVPAGRYYLYANAPTFHVLGQWVVADAYYDAALSYPDIIRNDKAGAIEIYRPAGAVLDAVGWDDNNNTAPSYETLSIPNAAANDGLGSPMGKQIVRVSSPAAGAADLAAYGRAYDSDSNQRDFLYESASFAGFVYPPRNVASGTFPVITGKVPSGAEVAASDPNSGSTQTYTAYVTSGSLSLPYARFTLLGVTTGTWNVAFGYGTYSQIVASVTVNQNLVTGIPNSVTTPAWVAPNLYHVPLSSVTDMGFVKGIVTNPYNIPLANIVVQSGGDQKTTSANGSYFMAVSSGAVNLVANPNNQNPSYVQTQAPVIIAQGATTTQDFTLSLGARLTGYCTTGTTPVANFVVAVLNGTNQAGSGTTDASGIFTVKNISTGTYTVTPVIEVGQDVNPNSAVVVLNSTGTVFVATFTVSGAFGSIDGTVTNGASLVTSGALVIASTASIPTSPPSIAGSSAPAMTPYYMVSSRADGSYVLPVRGGLTYNLSAYVPVIAANGTVSITTKTYSGIAVSVSGATTKNVTLP